MRTNFQPLTLALLPLLFLTAALAEEASLQPPGEQREKQLEAEVRAQIALLDNEDFAKREAAQKRLLQLGDVCRPYLKDALAKTLGSEGKSRIADLLRELGPGGVLWSLEGIGWPPVVVKDRVLAVQRDFLCCIQVDNGKEIWRAKVKASFAAHTCADEERAYFVSNHGDNMRQGEVTAVDIEDGKIAWRRELEGGGLIPRVSDGCLVVTSLSYRNGYRTVISCLDARTGESLWEKRLANQLARGEGASACRGKLYVATTGGPSSVLVNENLEKPIDKDFCRLYALDIATGNECWSVDMKQMNGRELVAPPTTTALEEHVLVDYKLAVGCSVNNNFDLECYSAKDGKLMWSRGCASAPAVTENHAFFLDPKVSNFTSVDVETGKDRWPQQALAVDTPCAHPTCTKEALFLTGRLPGSELVANDLMCEAQADHIFCVQPENGQVLWDAKLPAVYDCLRSEVAVAGGRLFIMGPKGKLYCLRAGVTGASNWFQHRGNGARTASDSPERK